MSSQAKRFIEENIELIEIGDHDRLIRKAIVDLSSKHFDEVKGILGCKNIDCGFLDSIQRFYTSNRINKIKCYNVGFGDCFLCKGENENGTKMLVDFGGSENYTNVKKDLIKELSCAERKLLMLSHLHSDHFSGLKKIRSKKQKDIFKFDEIYLPNYIANGGIYLLGSILLSSTNNSLIKLVKNILKIPALFPDFIKSDSKIYLLREGCKVYNTICAFQALLPLNRNNFAIKKGGGSASLENFVNAYKKIINYPQNDTEEIVAITAYSNEIGAAIDNLIVETRKQKEIDVDISEDELKELFKNYHNSLSLAFQEMYVKTDENVLFLGDAEAIDIDKCTFNSEYCFLKVQHHGTKSHFTKYLPRAKYYAISNGGKKSRQEISCCYGMQYSLTTTFVCPNNANCEMLKCLGGCRSTMTSHKYCGSCLFHEIII